MERTYFTEGEARSKIGKRIRTLREFSGVPSGTSGKIIDADTSRDGFNVAVRWDLPVEKTIVEAGVAAGEPYLLVQGGKPLVDWFSKDAYDRFLEGV